MILLNKTNTTIEFCLNRALIEKFGIAFRTKCGNYLIIPKSKVSGFLQQYKKDSINFINRYNFTHVDYFTDINKINYDYKESDKITHKELKRNSTP